MSYDWNEEDDLEIHNLRMVIEDCQFRIKGKVVVTEQDADWVKGVLEMIEYCRRQIMQIQRGVK